MCFIEEKHQKTIDNVLNKIYEVETAKVVKDRIMREYQNNINNKDISFCELFSRQHLKKFSIGILLNWFQQFSGINFYIMYTGQTFDSIKQGTGNTINFYGSLAIFAANFPSIYFSNRFGRKFNLIFGISSQLLSYILMIIIISEDINIWTSIFPIMLCYAGFSLGLGGTLNLYMSEFLPGVAIGLCLCLQWLLTALIGKFVPIYLTHLGPIYLMYFFGFNCLMG